MPPDDSTVRRFLLGLLPPADAERVAAALDPAAVTRAAAPDDTLLAALRSAPEPAPDPPEVARLMASLERLPAAGPPDSTADRPATPDPSDATAATASGPDAAPHAPDADLADLLAPAEAAGEVGRLGGFRVLALLGKGGMGAVFAGEDPRLGRKVALKVMLPRVAASLAARGRFLREAKAAAAVEHENVIPIYHVGEDRGVPFLAMPLLLGKPLDVRLEGRKPMRVPDLLVIGGQIAEGLAAAHATGLIHRDVKPANVWLEAKPDGTFRRVRLLDFGLARLAQEDDRLTNSGAILGTPAYMAPEQARGEDVDARADVFSLGCVLYQMATGRRPFTGKDTFSVLTSIAVDTPPPPAQVNPAVPPRLSSLVTRMLAKTPDLRPQSARAVADELAAVGAGLAVGALPVAEAVPMAEPAAGPHGTEVVPLPAGSATDWSVLANATPAPEPAPAPRRRSPAVWWATAAAVVVLLGAAVLAAPTVIRVVTNTGELVLAVDDPNLEVTVRQNGAVVADKTRNRTFVLTAGDGEVEFHDPDTGARAFTRTFRIDRGGKDVLTASMRDVADARPRPKTKPKDEPKREPPPAPLTPPGLSPLGPEALVANPAPVAGLDGWTVETVAPRGQVKALAYHPNGQVLAGLGDDNTVRIWDGDTGALDRAFVGLHYQRAAGIQPTLAWTPDGAKLAAVTQDGSMAVWEYPGGKLLRRSAPTEFVNSVAWAADGTLLAFGYRERAGDGTFTRQEIWEVDSGRTVRPAKLSFSIPRLVRWSPDKRWLFATFAGLSSALVPLDPSQSILSPAEGMTDAAFSPDSRWLLFTGRPKESKAPDEISLRLWNLSVGMLDRKFAPRHSGSSGVLAWSPDGRTVLYVTTDRLAPTLLNTTTGQTTPVAGLKAGSRECAAWSPDGRTLALGGERIEFIRAADAIATRWIDGHSGLPWSKSLAALSPDRAFLVQGVWNGPGMKLRTWDTATHTPLAPVTSIGSAGRHLAWRPDSKLFAAGPEGSPLATLLVDPRTGKVGTVEGGHSAAWSPDGNRIATADKSGKLYLTAPGGNRPPLILEPQGGNANTLALSPNGKMLASSVYAVSFQVWDTTTGGLVSEFSKTSGAGFVQMDWAPGGGQIAGIKGTPSWVNPVVVLDPTSRKETAALPGVVAGGIRWQADGTLLVSGGDYRLRVWNPQTGQVVREVAGPGPGEFTPDGSRLAANLAAGVRVWDVPAGRPGHTYLMLGEKEHLALTADGHFQGSPGVERQVVYVARKPDGTQETLSPAAFADRYGWRNDPARVTAAPAP